MWSPYDKNFFLKSLANYKKINKDFCFTLNDVGLDSNTKFFVNESLTVGNYVILREAVRMKRNKRIHSAFSMRGLVYVRKTANDQPIRIDEYEQLKSLFSTSGEAEFFLADHQVHDVL